MLPRGRSCTSSRRTGYSRCETAPLSAASSLCTSTSARTSAREVRAARSGISLSSIQPIG
eukprot:scaffold281282_cov36-Tisochrysis_lutea.AAC.3